MPNILRRLFDKKRDKIKEEKRKTEDEGDGEEPADAGETSDTALGDGVGALEFPDDCGGPSSGVDVVFVHGLRGSRLKTWSKGSVFWPRDLLKDDLKRARVITWGYDANIANAFSYASKESLFGHGNTLLNDLARLRKGITRPIIFICHSLGGLVVKEALITSDNYKNHKRYPALGEIYASTIGVIFMGTPHRGSSKESYGEIAANIAKLSFHQPNKQLLQTLKPDSHILEKQRNDFTTISNDLNIVCIREELPTGAGLIVAEASASYDGFNVTRGSIHANHMDIVKFPSRDEGYKRTLGWIEDIRDAKRPEAERENEMIESRKNDILKVLEFSSLKSREEGINEAYAETCSWILDDQSPNNEVRVKPPKFLSWLQNSEPFFWISGKAGCGKSTLMKYVYHDKRTKAELQRSKWARGKDLILIGYFFFDRGDKDQKSREGMLRSILYQVLSTRRELIPKVFSQRQFFGDKYLWDLNDKLEIPAQFLDWTNLSNAFISTLDHLRDSRICLFLDGLDEYRMVGRTNDYSEEELDLIYDGNNEDEAWGQSTWITDGHREIAQFLRRFKTHGNLKVCLSSRELVVFEQEFRIFPRIMVHEHTAESIAQYCGGRLSEETPDLVDLPEFVFAITEKSRGVFLWVRLVIDMLVNRHAEGSFKDELWKILDSLPPRLGGKDGLYMRMMQNIKLEYLPESKRLFQLVFTWAERVSDILTHPDIITLFLAEQWHLEAGSEQELRAKSDEYQFKTWDQWQPRWMNLQRRLKSRCGGLLEGAKEVQFMHQTAKQFLSRKYLWDKIFHNVVGFAATSDVDLALMSGFVRRLKCCAEAVITSDRHSIDHKTHTRMIAEDITPHLFDEVIDSDISSEIIRSTMQQAYYLSKWNLADGFHHSYMELLDEVDNVGGQLTSALRSSKDVPHSRWPEVYFRRETGDANLSFRSFLDLAILFGLHPYVEARVKDQGLSKDQLASFLLRATRFQWVLWRGSSYGTLSRSKAQLVEVLFREGADPNCRDTESNLGMASEEGWTAWTSFLQEGLTPYLLMDDDRFWENRITTTKLFLRYGADPTVRWYGPNDGKARRSSHAGGEVFTPGTVIKDSMGDKPQFKKDLDDILKLLGQADEKDLV